MIDWKRKLTSRKFWVAVIGFVTPILTAFNVAESEVTQITAIIMAGATLIAYILAEGWTDASDNTIQMMPIISDSEVDIEEEAEEDDDEEPELTEEPEVDLSKETGITPEQMMED